MKLYLWGYDSRRIEGT